jgi:hypothetical protein
MDIKVAMNEVMVKGRYASPVAANTVAVAVWNREALSRNGGKGIAAAVFGTINALLERAGHIGFKRHEWDAFYDWSGLPKVTVAKASTAKADDFLASIGM